MNKLFIGREKEQQQLRDYLNSDQSEFIAVYGRRRVGKTFLIQQVVGNDYAFYVAGMNNVYRKSWCLTNFSANYNIDITDFFTDLVKRKPKNKKVPTKSAKIKQIWLELSQKSITFVACLTNKATAYAYRKRRRAATLAVAV